MCHSIVSISGAISLNLLARIKRESQKSGYFICAYLKTADLQQWYDFMSNFWQ